MAMGCCVFVGELRGWFLVRLRVGLGGIGSVALVLFCTILSWYS